MILGKRISRGLRAEISLRLPTCVISRVTCSVVAKDFPNALGKFTPCFTNIAILGKIAALMGDTSPILLHIHRLLPNQVV